MNRQETKVGFPITVTRNRIRRGLQVQVSGEADKYRKGTKETSHNAAVHPQSTALASAATANFSIGPVSSSTNLMNRREDAASNQKSSPRQFNASLNARNPHLSPNMVYYSLKEREFKREDAEHAVTLINIEGCCISVQPAADDAGYDGTTQIAGSGHANELLEATTNYAHKSTSLRNRIEFCEMGTQTSGSFKREKGIRTAPIALKRSIGSVSKSQIHDSKLLLKGSSICLKDSLMFCLKKGAGPILTEENSNNGVASGEKLPADMNISLLIIERILNQIRDKEIYKEIFFKAEKKKDSFFPEEEANVKLFHFHTFGKETSSLPKKLETTCVECNPKYPDLIAVGFGVSVVPAPAKCAGYITFYSLKSIRQPEKIFLCDQPVSCISWSVRFPNMLAIGTQRGLVQLYDYARVKNHITFSGNSHKVALQYPVVAVKWKESDDKILPNLISISLNGQIAIWTYTSKTLQLDYAIEFFSVSELKLSHKEVPVPALEDSTSQEGSKPRKIRDHPLCILSFDFHPTDNNVFLIGSTEGTIHKCSILVGNHYSDVYKGHGLGVSTVRWNKIFPDIFLSGSADWTVKIWSVEKKCLLATYDLRQPIADVNWIPRFSASFIAVTGVGEILTYDLHANPYEAVSHEKTASEYPSTLAFNERFDILLLGDKAGNTSCLKICKTMLEIDQGHKFTSEFMEETPKKPLKIEKFLSSTLRMKQQFQIAQSSRSVCTN